MSEPGRNLYENIAALVSGYVDDKIAELRFELPDPNREDDPIWKLLTAHNEHIRQLESLFASMQATMGGLRDAVGELQQKESMPEHLYKQFIRAEAERLKIVKPVRTPPPSTPDPNTSQ